MRIFLLLLSIIQLTEASAQHSKYQVVINGKRAGCYTQNVERGTDIDFFTSLKIEIKTFQDTTYYTQTTHTIETDSGKLKYIEWTNILLDTTRFQYVIKNDSLYKSKPISKTFIQKLDTTLLGPEKIRKLSIEHLDTIGAKLYYSTFAPEFDAPISVCRELLGHTIEDAIKLNIVKESFNDKQFTIKKYDKSFALVEAVTNAAMGKIKIFRSPRLEDSQFFGSIINNHGLISANILFPDPERISSTKIKIETATTNSLVLDFGHQRLLTSDSNQWIIRTHTSKTKAQPTEAIALTQEYIWPDAKAKKIATELVPDTSNVRNDLSKLIAYAKSQGRYAALAFCQLANLASLPTRLVYGYSYDKWFWKPTVWAETAHDGQWRVVDFIDESVSNPALKIILYRNQPGEPLAQSYLSIIPILKNIQVESYELNGRNYAVSDQVLRYYFESPVYENEGLGMRFNLPEGYEIVDDGTKKPSENFLVIQNKSEELIKFSQLLNKKNIPQQTLAITHLVKNLNVTDTDITFNKKLNLWMAVRESKGMIAIPQGSSLIVIRIDAQDPESLTQWLVEKNLQFKN